MRKVQSCLKLTLLLAALVLAIPLSISAQNREKFVISARAGGVNSVTGRTSMRPHGNNEWRQLTIKEDLETGDAVKTGNDGRVELLLNPGSYMRVGENSEFEFTDSSLENLEVRLLSGTAILEVTGADDTDLFIGITTPHTRMSITRRGLYRVSVVPGDNTELIVRKGRVVLEGSHTKVKGGDKVVFSNSSFSVARLTDAQQKDRDGLDLWSKERAQTLARENANFSRQTLDTFASSFRNDWGFSGLWGGSGLWFYSSIAGCYTFVPFFSSFGSPYGNRYTGLYNRGGPRWGNAGEALPLYPPGGYPGAGGSSNSGSRGWGSGGSGGGTPAFNPPSAPARNPEQPMMGGRKPDISPGGPGMVRPDQR
ncbi:MAG TPA: FecR family protein [Pyrinomonadaceae bacterium]|nr:FecR family protein [Pyrinomonadaceae bacterium]